MVINHNLSAMYASRQLNLVNASTQVDAAKLSSGERITKASDDASGLSISEKMRAQIRGLNRASKNIQDASSLVQTTDGYLSELTDVVQRIRELAVQAGNGVYQAEERQMMQIEVSQLISEVDRIASQASFNGMNLLSGRFDANKGTEALQFTIGANVDQRISLNISAMTASDLGLKGEGQDGANGSSISLADTESANVGIATLDEALKKINMQRADLGAAQSKLEFGKKGIDIAAENLQASESRIRDVDVAQQMTEFSKNQILQNASGAMLSQSMALNNQVVLQLLRG